ncbi:MAG: rhodanese-related sulfurtransferase [Erythrobacter sp.]|nr:MAG: rhodanese-related sulfurtransferase [Erythrobacter sp.]
MSLSTPAIEGPIQVAALYRFARFDDPQALRGPLAELCKAHGVKGTLLLAQEGINGTIAGSPEGITAVLDHIRSLPDCAAIEVKFSGAATMPFHRMKVRVKREIVTMGQPGLDPRERAGVYVEPQDWNALIADPGTIVIDTRNDYEVAVGQFEGAIDPQTPSFADFPAWFRQHRERLLAANNGQPPRVAMYCTGGIRCEKSTAFLAAEGVAEVYHLKGGILKYLEEVPAELSQWRGECFVFDQRVSVGHGLVPGTHLLCHACRRPVNEADAASPLYEEGVSCPACHAERTEEQRASYRERQRQELLAAQRGYAHVGAVRDSDGPDAGDG